MKTSTGLPAQAIRVPTYGELGNYARAFGDKRFNLLIVAGDPGLGKSQAFKAALGNRARWLEGHASAFGAYRDLYHHRDEPVVLDDVGGLDNDPKWAHLLKCLCQTDRVKTLNWQTDAATLAREDIPRTYTTSSRVCIICNDWRLRNKDVQAVGDRGQFIVFDPSPREVHAQTARWFWDQQVYDFVANHLHLAPRVSMRDYYRAWELKRAGIDWRAVLLGRWAIHPNTATAALLLADPSFKNEEARAVAFVAGGHGCRATYFSHARKVKSAGPPLPPATLAGTPPDVDDTPGPDAPPSGGPAATQGTRPDAKPAAAAKAGRRGGRRARKG